MPMDEHGGVIQRTVGKHVHRIARWASKHIVKLIVLLVAVWVGLFVLGQALKPFLFIAFFLAISSFSLIYNRWIKTSLGIEFITMSTLLTARHYGVWPAVFVGLFGLATAEIIGTGFNAKTVISLFAIVIMAFIGPLFNGMPLFAAGMLFIIIYDIIIIPLYIMSGSNAFKSMLFVVTHVIFNAWVFFYLAPIIERLMI